MPINSDKPHLWKADVSQSIDFYNDWFIRFAPGTYRKQRVIRTNDPINIDLKKRQLAALKRLFLRHGHKQTTFDEADSLDAIPPGTFIIPFTFSVGKKRPLVKIPIDCFMNPIRAGKRAQPYVIEAKASGSATITSRWRRKEALKFTLLKERYGEKVKLILLLSGYIDPGYLGYVASEGIDWVWEHRLNDLSALLGGGK